MIEKKYADLLDMIAEIIVTKNAVINSKNAEIERLKSDIENLIDRLNADICIRMVTNE